MGSLRTAQRKLKEKNVWIAQETDRKKVKFLQMLVKEKVKQDAEFAKDVLKAVGENLPKEIKEAAEATIAKENAVSEKIEEMKQEYGTVLESPSDIDPIVTDAELQVVADKAVEETIEEADKFGEKLWQPTSTEKAAKLDCEPYGNPDSLPLEYDKEKHKLP